jgi:nucleoside 2-deoxyribosyltransferase
LKVYLAGPEVFLPDALEVGRRKVEICARHGLIGLFPLDLNEPARPMTASDIFGACIAAMTQADAIVANLTPFRGIGADPGTAFEFGYMVALGRRVFGYTNEPRTLFDRTMEHAGPLHHAGRQPFAADGLAVEDFGHFDNLMLAEALLAHGPGVFAPEVPLRDPARDLTVFAECVARAADLLQGAGTGSAGPNR